MSMRQLKKDLPMSSQEFAVIKKLQQEVDRLSNDFYRLMGMIDKVTERLESVEKDLKYHYHNSQVFFDKDLNK